MSVGNDTSVVIGVIESWKKFGIFDVVLPFLLVFSIVYGILGRTKVFGEKGPAVNAIIAFTIAMTSVLTGWFVGFITGFLPWVSIISIIIVCGLMLVAMFAKDLDKFFEGPYAKTTMIIGAVIVVISLTAVLIGMAAQGTGMELSVDNLLSAMGMSAVDMWGIVFFIAFIVVIFFISKSPKAGGSKEA